MPYSFLKVFFCVILSQEVLFESSYILKEKIGSGKFSKVYKATQTATGNTVAVKIINKEDMNESEKEMIKNEIGIAKIIQHPNIVRFYSVLQSAKHVYFITELISEKNLLQYIDSEKQLSEYQAANITFYLLCAIQYMHDNGVIHRDLKPENVMVELTEDNTTIITAKIIDFGLSMTILPNKVILEQCGTITYIAPEIFLKYGYGQEADLWSIGIILYYMLMGCLPYDSRDKIIMLSTILNAEMKFEYRDISLEGNSIVYNSKRLT